MPFVVAPSKNRVVQAAFAGLEKEQRAEKKADVHKSEPKPAQVGPDVHKKARKVHTPAAKKSKRGGRK